MQPTGHVHHPAVAVLHDVARLAVDPAGRHAVDVEEAQGLGLALPPRRRQVGELWGEEGEGERWGSTKPAEAEEDEDQLTARRESQNIEQMSGNAEGERDQSRPLDVLIYPLFKVFRG